VVASLVMCTDPCGLDADDRPASEFRIQETDELWRHRYNSGTIYDNVLFKKSWLIQYCRISEKCYYTMWEGL